MTEREKDYCPHAVEIAEIKQQIKTLFVNLSDFTELTKSVTKLAESMNYVKNDVQDIKSEMKDIKEEKIKDFNHYKRLIAGGILSAMMGFLIGRFLM